MGRLYTHSFECGNRMRKFSEDPDGDPLFFFCRGCSPRWIHMALRDAASGDWPKDVFEEAVTEGVMTPEGKPPV